MAIESKYKNRITACLGRGCPLKHSCKKWYNRTERVIWQKIRPPFHKDRGCGEFEQI